MCSHLCCHVLMLYHIICVVLLCILFFFKQKTAYEMRISDWSSDVCSSDLAPNSLTQAHFSAPPAAPITLIDARRSVAMTGAPASFEIGRASCRERVCQYV